MPTKKNIETPEILYRHFKSYKKNCKKNPKKENFWSSKSDKEVSVSREIPYTWDGFEIWLKKKRILVRLDDYKTNKDNRYSKYADIIHAIDKEIYEDKFTGAAAGIYQTNIIARDLGLKDRRDLTTDDDKLYSNLSEEDKQDIVDKIKNASK